MKERSIILEAIGAEAYIRDQKRHPNAGIFSHIGAGFEQFLFPAQDRPSRYVEEEQDRIDLIPGLVEKSHRLSELTSEIKRPQYWRKAKLIDIVSTLVWGGSMAAIAMNMHLSFAVVTATLAKVLINSAVIKFNTKS